MLFNSIEFLIFFPIAVLGFFLIPAKVRYIWLLICSYYFYMSWNPKYMLLILFSTCVTYTSGLLIEKVANKAVRYKNYIVAASFVLNLSLLFYFKYFNFVVENINYIMRKAGVGLQASGIDVLLPVGISFYVFQALGYTVDVYRGTIKPEKNFLKYALFVSFFPQLVAGPIERSKNLLVQISADHRLKYHNLKSGVLWMLWGYFMKLVLADRIAIVVDEVYGTPGTYKGFYVIVATVLFAFQIYCDFNGYTMIARGCAKIMDFDLMENFNAPYFSETVSEFWRRWHISLSSWFKDYLYIPLGGNRKGNLRKYINLMIVFLLSGAWHGAAWGYIIWGGLNGLYQIAGGLLAKSRGRVKQYLHISDNVVSHRLIKTVITFMCIDFSWIFFRARGLHDSLSMVKSIFVFNPEVLFDGIFSLGLEREEFYFLIGMLLILLVVDFVKYLGINVTAAILKQGFWLKAIIYVALFWIVILTGVYGTDYDASSFIYFQF